MMEHSAESGSHLTGPRIHRLDGIGVSPGVAIGTLQPATVPDLVVQPRDLTTAEVEPEVARFRGCVDAVVAEVEDVRDAMTGELGQEGAAIFEAQLMILHDPMAIDATIDAIRAERRNAEFVFRQTVLRVLESFDAMPEGLFKERAADILDVKRRLLHRLTGQTPRPLVPPDSTDTIVVARELTPSDTVALASSRVRGVVTERGGTTSHAAIMARAQRLPAVMGIPGVVELVRPGTPAIVDGWRGHLVLHPDDEEVRRYEAAQRHHEDLLHRLELLRELPSVTTDGREVHLHANVEMPMEIESVGENGASGVGLFRTEFFLMQQHRLATEEEQFEVYRRGVETLAPKPMVIRTVDLGGDKFASYIGSDRERNPFLGLRGIRFLLGHLDVFRAQLRAILRASAYGPVRMLFPMVTTPEELLQAREQVDRAMDELRAEGVSFDRHVPVGVMIETPAAVLMADVLARHCDFFSIGSNDLTQYTLAVDRTNARLGYLFTPLHPAVLRAIQATVEAAHREGCWVSLCGEMAGETLATPLLVGLGLDDLSMSPPLVPEVKQMIRSISFAEASGIAIRAVRLSTAREVTTLLHDFLRDRFPELLEVKGL
jgi:phosphotransferase system enzyme I (PtsI)